MHNDLNLECRAHGAFSGGGHKKRWNANGKHSARQKMCNFNASSLAALITMEMGRDNKKLHLRNMRNEHFPFCCSAPFAVCVFNSSRVALSSHISSSSTVDACYLLLCPKYIFFVLLSSKVMFFNRFSERATSRYLIKRIKCFVSRWFNTWFCIPSLQRFLLLLQ